MAQTAEISVTCEKNVFGTLHLSLSANQPKVWCETPASNMSGGNHVQSCIFSLDLSHLDSLICLPPCMSGFSLCFKVHSISISWTNIGKYLSGNQKLLQSGKRTIHIHLQCSVWLLPIFNTCPGLLPHSLKVK